MKHYGRNIQVIRENLYGKRVPLLGLKIVVTDSLVLNQTLALDYLEIQKIILVYMGPHGPTFSFTRCYKNANLFYF
jgi:hypothetical protein